MTDLRKFLAWRALTWPMAAIMDILRAVSRRRSSCRSLWLAMMATSETIQWPCV